MKSQITITEILTPLDITVLVGSIALTVAALFFSERDRRRQKSKANSMVELLLMSRKLTLPLFVTSLVATWYGGIFGVTQIAFESGVYNFVTQGVFWYVAYIFFALVLVDKVRSFSTLSLPELAGKLFGPKSRKVAAVFNFFNVLPISYCVSLGLFFQALFGGSLFLWMTIGLTFSTAYTALGGFRADTYTDFVQFFFMCSSVILIAVFSVFQFGGWDYLTAHLPATHFEWTGGHGVLETLSWGLIALVTLVDPNFYQRCFAAPDARVAKRGLFLATGIWIVFDLCTTTGALYARAAIPEAESGLSYLTYGLQLLPKGLRGLFLAGILATILSTLDSFLLIAGTTLTYDLGKSKWHERRRFAILGIVFSSLLTLFIADHFEGNIKAIWKTLGSYAAACLLFPILFAYWKPGKIRDLHFVVATIAGAIAVTLWRTSTRTGFWADIDEVYIGILTTAAFVLCFVSTSQPKKPS